jgi:hypothetical protein
MLVVVFTGTGLINSLYKYLLLIFKQMKKIFFLVLTFLIMNAASMNGQVRIGGTADPNASAVLDLNATDAANNSTLGLALPRVNISSSTAKLDGTNTPPDGMLVYNTNTTLGAGIYYWSGSSWTKIPNTDNNDTYSAASGGGLSLSGTAFSIASQGVTSDMIKNETIATSDIANGAVTAAKIAQMDATQGQLLGYNGSAWAPKSVTAGELGSVIKSIQYVSGNNTEGTSTIDVPIATVVPGKTIALPTFLYTNAMSNWAYVAWVSANSVHLVDHSKSGIYALVIIEFY